jgi:hypothetical protein
MSRVVKIARTRLPPPYNPLDLPDGESVTFVAKSYEIADCEREISVGPEKTVVKGKIMRIYVDLSTPVFGAPYLDVLAGRTIALLEGIFKTVKLPLKLTLRASGKEPHKWYEVTYERLA